MLEVRGYRRQSTAYIDRPDIPTPCSSLGQGYLRNIQNSLTPEHRTSRHATTYRLQRPSKSFVFRKVNLSSSLATDLKFESEDKGGSLKPFSKSTSNSQNLSSKLSPAVQSTSLQLALYSSFSTVPRAVKKISSTSVTPTIPKLQKQCRRRRETVATSQDVLLRLSLPCRAGCCYCVYASLMGPVRVSFSQGSTPSRGRFLAGIRDGNGRAAIPSSRKADIRGLVYDPLNHSLHPPALGERPMFRKFNLLKDDKDRSRISTKQGKVSLEKVNEREKMRQETGSQRKRKVTLAHGAYNNNRKSVG